MGNYYWGQGNLAEATKYFELSLQENPNVIAYVDRPSAMVNLAGVFVAQDHNEEAQKLLQEVIGTTAGENALLARYNLALIAYNQNDYQTVVNLLDGHITGWNKEEPWILLIRTYVALENRKETERVIKEAWPYLNPHLKTQLKYFTP